MINKINYREKNEFDKKWIDKFIKAHWGSKQVVVHKTIYIPSELNGFIAEITKEKIGLITYQIKNKICEIVSLNSIKENKGVGTKLVELVIKQAKDLSCKKIWLVTTNDNIKAIYFYQKLGFQLVKVLLNAVAESRKIKPEIPEIANNGLLIKDEIEFVLKLNYG